MTSHGWFLAMTLGGVLAAIGTVVAAVGNIKYAQARENEQRAEAHAQAENILREEARANLKLLKLFTNTIRHENIPNRKLSMAGWEAVSKSSLAGNMDASEIKTYLETYQEIARWNEFHSQILDLNIGLNSALMSAAMNRHALNTLWADCSEDLEKRLSKIADSDSPIH